jgi:hypothetical protein
LRRRVAAVDAETTLPGRPLSAVKVGGIAHVRLGIEAVPVVIIAARAHPTGRITYSPVEHNYGIVKVALVD